MKGTFQSELLLRDAGSGTGGLLVSELPAGPAAEKQDAPPLRILKPGRNVWRIARSKRSAFLVDADNYFRWLEHALRMATRSIWIIAWDFNGDIRLHPDRDDRQQTLGELLRDLVERRPGLEVRILVWSLGQLYSGKSLKMFISRGWADHPRIHIRYDRKHPLRGSHHQKVVCIDDAIAFAGGIDLTAKRWDTCDHAAQSPARLAEDGQPYCPVHDVQMAVEEDAARALGDLARARWRFATGEIVPACSRTGRRWPKGLTPDMVDTDVAIARTQSWISGRRDRREAYALNLDALMSARRHIYIEAQYFASPAIANILARRLRERNGPDIVILVTNSSRGLIERFVMGGNRDRLIRRLARADRYGRLRVMYAVVPDGKGGDCEILIHSKVLIIDDVFLRIGSSNLNHRSEGLDTECDLAVEARSEDERRAIAAFRDRLLAEHLCASPAKVSGALEKLGSLVRAVDLLNIEPRCLRPIHVDPNGGAVRTMPGTGLLDPREPYWPLPKLRTALSSLWLRLSGRRP